MNGVKIAVLGASGQVGREMLQVLAAQDVPLAQVTALATAQSQGSNLSYGDDEIIVGDAKQFDFTTVDVVLAALPARAVAELLPHIAKQGVLCVDVSTAFVADPDVPLMVPAVDATVLQNLKKNIVVSPDARAVQLATVLAPLHKLANIKRVVVSVLQSASTVSRAAMDELFSQTRAVYVNDTLTKEEFTKQIAFNVIPQVGSFKDDGQTEGEFGLVHALKRLLDARIKYAVSAAYVAAFLGTGMLVNIECVDEVDAAGARRVLKSAAGVSVVDHHHEEGIVTLVETAGEEHVFVSRVRDDSSADNAINLWCAADTVHLTALNAVRIAAAWGKRRLN